MDRVELVRVEAQDARVLLRGRQAVDLHDHALVGTGLRDYQSLVGGHEVLGLELGERERGGHQDEDGRVGPEAAVPVDERALEAQAVASRAADQRDVPQTLLQRVGELLLVAREAVHQQEGEGVPALVAGSAVLKLAAQVLRERHPVRDLEPAQVLEVTDLDAADLGREAHAGDAVVAAAERSDLPGRRAADHRHAGEAPGHRGGQRVMVELAGAEEEHEGGVQLPEAVVKRLHYRSGILCTGVRDAHGPLIAHKQSLLASPPASPAGVHAHDTSRGVFMEAWPAT